MLFYPIKHTLKTLSKPSLNHLVIRAKSDGQQRCIASTSAFAAAIGIFGKCTFSLNGITVEAQEQSATSASPVGTFCQKWEVSTTPELQGSQLEETGILLLTDNFLYAFNGEVMQSISRPSGRCQLSSASSSPSCNVVCCADKGKRSDGQPNETSTPSTTRFLLPNPSNAGSSAVSFLL
jgi:hypothetical protein